MIEIIKPNGEVEAHEGPTLEQLDLPAAPFFRWRAIDLDADPGLLGHPSERPGRADGGGGDEVVPTGMAETRQGVVLGD